MDPFGIITLIFGVLLTAAEVASNAAANKENRNFQQNVLEQQQQFSTQAAQTANDQTISNYWELYSPQSRVEQLKNAGLSVGLMYGGYGAQGQTAPMATTPSTSLPYLNPIIPGGQLNNMMNALTAETNAENTRKDTEKKEAEIGEINQKIENMKKEIEQADATIKKIEEETKTEIVSRANMELDGEIKKIELKYKEANEAEQLKLVTQEIELVSNNAAKTLKEIDLMKIDEANRQKMYDAQVTKMYAETQKIMTERGLTVLQYATEAAKQRLTLIETELKEKQGKLTDEQTNNLIKEREQITSLINRANAETEKISQDTKIGAYQLRSYENGFYHTDNSKGNPVNAFIGILQDFSTWITGENKTK